VFFFIIFKIK